MALRHPSLAALVQWLESPSAADFAEVRIHSLGLAGQGSYQLRNAADREVEERLLTPVSLKELAALVQFTSDGLFRPIKTAPTLRRGWSCLVPGVDALGEALDVIYPGAVVDWWSASQSPPPVQSFREFTGRQTGMYRITQQLTDSEAAAVIQAGCDKSLCLRRREWTVEGLPPDGLYSGKSVIPCWEPCPVLLELARRERRSVQSERTPLLLSTGESATLQAVLDRALAHPGAGVADGDLADPENPRRIRLIRDRIQRLFSTGPEGESTRQEKGGKTE